MKLPRCRVAWKLSGSSKSIGIASSKEARKKTAPSLKALGIATGKVCEHLGIDFQTGSRLVRAKQAARIRSVQARMGRFVRLGKTAGPRVFGKGGFPAMRHGADVVGITLTTMKTINRMTAMTFSSSVVGRSNFAHFKLTGCNPGHIMFLDPLVTWTRAIWDEAVQANELADG